MTLMCVTDACARSWNLPMAGFRHSPPRGLWFWKAGVDLRLGLGWERLPGVLAVLSACHGLGLEAGSAARPVWLHGPPPGRSAGGGLLPSGPSVSQNIREES